MSRFYKPTVPTIGTDFMFETPWDEVVKTMDAQQLRYDKNLASAELLRGKLNVNHLNTQFDTEAVQQARDYYTNDINNIAQKLMQDPTARVGADLARLSADLDTNLRSGDLAKVQGRYNAVQAWQKENAKMKEANPDIYNRAYASGMRSLMQGYDRSGHGASWGEDSIMEDIDWSDEMSKIIKDMEPDMNKNGYVNIGGKWIYKGSNENKSLSAARILTMVENKIKANPKFAGYVQQRGRYGLPGYIDAEGSVIPMFAKDAKGNYQINQNSAFAPVLKHGTAFAYNQTESTQDASMNPEYLQSMKDRAAMTRVQAAKPPKEESAISLFEITQNVATPAEQKAIENELRTKWGSRIPTINGMQTTQGVTSAMRNFIKDAKTTLQNKNLNPTTKAAVELGLREAEADYYNLNKKEYTSSWANLVPAFVASGAKPERAQKSVEALAKQTGVYYNNPNLLGTVAGEHSISIKQPGGRVIRYNGVPTTGMFTLGVKNGNPTHYKEANNAVNTMLKEIQDDPVGGMTKYGVGVPTPKIVVTNPKDPNFMKTNGVSTKLITYYEKDGKRYVVEYDYKIPLGNMAVDRYTPTELTGNDYRFLPGNPSGPSTHEDAQAFQYQQAMSEALSGYAE